MIHDSLLFIVVAIWIWLRIACLLRGRLTVLNTFCLCLQKSIRHYRGSRSSPPQ